jgi:hypothetical protein
VGFLPPDEGLLLAFRCWFLIAVLGFGSVGVFTETSA